MKKIQGLQALMELHQFISDEVTMSLGWGNMNDGSQGFFNQPSLLCGAEPNDTGMGNDNDENMGGGDTDMHSQPAILTFLVIS